MTHNEFHFVSRWHVSASRSATFERLIDIGGFARWWPGFHTTASRAPPTAVGHAAHVELRSLIPVALRFDLLIVSAVENEELCAAAEGDLRGSARVHLREAQASTEVVFDWNVALEHPWLRPLSMPFRPLFVLSHDLMMRRGERGLERVLNAEARTESKLQ
jgi:hypothetical protein